MPLAAITGDVTIIWSDVLDFAPELAAAGITVTQQTVCLNKCQEEITLARWGAINLVNEAALYYAAHLATGFRLGLWSPALTNVSAGGVSKGFKQRAEHPHELEQTRYGLMYLAMIKQYLPRFFMA